MTVFLVIFIIIGSERLIKPVQQAPGAKIKKTDGTFPGDKSHRERQVNDMPEAENVLL